MELNPNNPLVAQVHDHWHKIAAMIMVKQGLTELWIDHNDITRLAQGNINIVLEHNNQPGNQNVLHIRIVDDETAARLAKENP